MLAVMETGCPQAVAPGRVEVSARRPATFSLSSARVREASLSVSSTPRRKIPVSPSTTQPSPVLAWERRCLTPVTVGIPKERATTERLDMVNGVGDTPNRHDLLTGSQPDGTAFDGSEDRTCNNWTSSDEGQAQVGHHDRMGRGDGLNSWNSEHTSGGCSQESLESTGGAGLFYCFAID